MTIDKSVFRILSKLNKLFLPSYIHRDLMKLKWYDKAIVGWRYWVTKKAL